MPAFDRDAAEPAPVDAAPGMNAATIDTEDGLELDTRHLFAVTRRRVIVHQGERYCLQLTRAGKLLLTK